MWKMSEIDPNLPTYQIGMTPEGVYTMYYAVEQAIRYWPGSPQRPIEEQEVLYELKNVLFALKMEILMADQAGDSPS